MDINEIIHLHTALRVNYTMCTPSTIIIIIRQQSQDLSACMGWEQGSGDDAYIIPVAIINDV